MQTPHMARLRDMASAKCLPGNDRLVQTLGAACLTPDVTLDTVEAALLGDILRQLVRDVEIPVRRALAKLLSNRDDAPRDLIVLLANDVIDVAYPILATSDLLEDQDLIDIVTRHARQHALAVTDRTDISAPVGDALIATGDTGVKVALLRNAGADLDPRSLDALADESRHVEALRAPLLSRKDLNIDTAIRMTDWVGESLRRIIHSRFEINDEHLRGAVSDAVLEAIDDDIFGGMASDQAPTTGTGGALLDALSHDDIARFKQIFESAISLDPAWAERSLYPSVEALAIASRAIGLHLETYTRILCHLHSTDIYETFRGGSLHARMVAYFEAIDQTSAAAVLAGWRKTSHPGAATVSTLDREGARR